LCRPGECQFGMQRPETCADLLSLDIQFSQSLRLGCDCLTETILAARRIHETEPYRESAGRRQVLKALEHVRVLAHQENERCSLVVWLAPPLFPALKCARIDADAVGEGRT